MVSTTLIRLFFTFINNIFGLYWDFWTVCTWSGDRTELDKIVAEQMRNDLRRDKTDAYNEEYDRGKVIS